MLHAAGRKIIPLPHANTRLRRGSSPSLLAVLVACSAEPAERAAAAAEGGPPVHDERSVAACGNCHPDHFEQWRLSPHAYAMRDPVFHAMVRVGQRETE